MLVCFVDFLLYFQSLLVSCSATIKFCFYNVFHVALSMTQVLVFSNSGHSETRSGKIKKTTVMCLVGAGIHCVPLEMDE